MFSFKSLGHAFATFAHDVKVAIQWAIQNQRAIDTTITVAADVIATLDPSVAALAFEIERASEALLGEALAAVSTLSAADASTGIVIHMQPEVVKDVVDLLNKMKAAKGNIQLPLLPPLAVRS